MFLALPAAGADYADPTWPCIQRKAEQLSVGLMWPHPIDELTMDPETRAEVEELAGLMALRRVELSSLQPQVADFAAAHGGDEALLGQVFSSIFERIARHRTRIIKGIGDYSLKQIALAERIDATRSEMASLMDSDSPDFDRVDALEEQLDWDERVYTDRARSLTYVCETPVLLEQRLYAIAQMLLAAAQ